MAIFLSGMKIFKIAFQHVQVVDNSCMVPIVPFSATNFSHMTLFKRFGVKHFFFTILDSTPKRDAWFSFLFLEMVWIGAILKTVPAFFDAW